MSKKGVMIRTGIKSIPRRGRATQGVYIMRMKKGDRVASMSFIIKDSAEQTEAEQNKESKAKAKEKQQALV